MDYFWRILVCLFGFINQGFNLYFSLVISYQLYLDPIPSLLFKMAFNIGGILGNIISYHILHKYGYEKIIYLMYIVSVIGWYFIWICESWQYYEVLLLIIGRFVMGVSVGIGFCILPVVLLQSFFPDSSWRYLAFSLPCFMITVCGGISYFFAMCFSWQLVAELCLLSSLFELLVTVNFSGCLDSVHVTDSLLFQLNKQVIINDSLKKSNTLIYQKISLLLHFFQAYISPDFLLNNAQFICSNVSNNTLLCHLNIILLLVIFMGIAMGFIHLIYGVWNLFINAVLVAMVYMLVYTWNISLFDQVLIWPSTTLNILMIILCAACSFGWGQLPYIMLMNNGIVEQALYQYFLYKCFLSWWISNLIQTIVWHIFIQLWYFHYISFCLSVICLIASTLPVVDYLVK